MAQISELASTSLVHRRGVQIDRRSNNGGIGTLGAIVLGAGSIAVWLVAKAALKVFSRVAVFTGVGIFVGSTVVLVYLLNRQTTDDQLKRDRDYALRQLWQIARPYRGALTAGLVLVVMGRVLQVAAVAVVGAIIDTLISGTGLSFLGGLFLGQPLSVTALATIAALCILGSSLVDFFSKIFWMHAAHQIAHDLRIALYNHLQSLEMMRITSDSRSTYLALLHNDINRIEVLFESTWSALREIAYAGASILCFFIIDPAFAGLVSVPLPGLLLLSYALEKNIRPRHAKIRDEAGKLHEVLASTMDGIETTRAFNTESQTLKWVDQASVRYYEEQDSALVVISTYDPAMWGVANTMRLTTSIAAGFYTAAGNMSIGAYITLVTLATSLALPLRGISRDFPHILASLVSLSRVFEAFNLPVENRTNGRRIDPGQLSGNIRFDDVKFAYNPSQPLFKDFSVEIAPGRVTGFVGPTGSGKSTLAKLLLRFYDPADGSISLDDWNIEGLSRETVRRCIGYVGQDVFLFNSSIRDNIAFGQPNVNMNDIVMAARIAGAHDFITALPSGYDTSVGDRGQKLSGGERQRIGIARAIILQRPIVILDEATSSLDAVTEANTVKQLAESLAGRTVIVIAHRLSAVRHANRIHVLTDGSIIEAGTHEELLKQGGHYATYWELQTRELPDL